VTSNTDTNVVGTLAGGSEDDWDVSDAYTLTGTTMAGLDGTAPDINFYIQYSANWNPRISGAKLYMRKVQADEKSDWYPQIEYDFKAGTAKTYLNGYMSKCDIRCQY